MSTAENPQLRYTYADYLSWPEGERWEILAGVAYAMVPAPSPEHQTLLFEFSRQLGNWLLGKPCKGFAAPLDVRLPEDNEADEQIDTVVQPDLFVVCDEKKIDRRGVRGAPEFIIEIASPRSAVHDEITKTRLYEKHGVREYWLVRPAERLITVRLLTPEGSYAAPQFCEAKGRKAVAVLEGFEFDLDLAFEQLPRSGE